MIGQVLPFELGQDGVQVGVEGRKYPLPAGVPGDRVRIRLPGPRGGFAHKVDLDRAADQRTVAPCALLDSCGGCSLQAMRYQAQLEAKTAQLRRGIAALGCAPEQVDEVVGLPRHFGYRTKLLMTAGGEDSLRLGFYQRGSLDHIPAEGCPVQHPLALAVLAMVRQVLWAHRVHASKDSGGWLHALAIRVDPEGGDSELTLIGRTTRIPGGKKTVDQLIRIPSVSSVHLCAAEKRSSFPLEPPFKRLAGQRRMTFHLAGQRILLSPGTFFQTSHMGAELLLEQVRRHLPRRIELLADLYAGAGLFSLLTTDRWRRAIAVESSESAVSDLKHYMTRTGAPVRGLSVMADPVEFCIEDVLRKEPEVVLLDPPRKGCHPKVIDALLQRRPPEILYASCGFTSLMREGRRLVDGGYELCAASAVDLFPHTAHLEVVARFRYSESPGG